MNEKLKRIVFVVIFGTAAFLSGRGYENHGKVNLLDAFLGAACAVGLMQKR